MQNWTDTEKTCVTEATASSVLSAPKSVLENAQTAWLPDMIRLHSVQDSSLAGFSCVIFEKGKKAEKKVMLKHYK